MRNWLRQRLLNLLVGGDAEVKVIHRANGRRRSVGDWEEDVIESTDSGIDLPDPIRFRVQQVSGGTVIETKYYDHKKDEERVKLHIVTPEENLAESIGKIVTMELLQK